MKLETNILVRLPDGLLKEVKFSIRPAPRSPEVIKTLALQDQVRAELAWYDEILSHLTDRRFLTIRGKLLFLDREFEKFGQEIQNMSKSRPTNHVLTIGSLRFRLPF